MNALLHTPMFGITLTFAAYEFSYMIARRVKSPLVNPMALAALLCILFLLITGIPLSAYQVGGDFLMMLIFPATTCIAVSVYNQMELLKRHLIPIIIGCTVGAAVSIGSIMLLSRWFGLTELLTLTLLPKSVTSAIAIELSALIGGTPSLTILAVMVTGTTGVITSPMLIQLLRIEDPIVQGVALGTSSHVIGTAKALEYGPSQGGMSGIAIFVTGLATVFLTLLVS